QFLELKEGESIEGKTVFDFFPKTIAALYDADDQEVFERGVSLRNREEPTLTRSGVESWLSTTKVPLRDPAGRILGLVCVSADITERKAAEEQLKRFASQLERSNAELQNFASVASHDLQEPLRKIQAFGDRLRVKCAPQLGDAGLDYLERMQNAAERMRVLIQDLLKLTRVTSRAQPFERCDLNEVVREVVSDLEVAIEQQSAQVVIDSLPVIDADPVQMRQLFQNLISNALKFQKEGERPRVDVKMIPSEAGEEV
ncbi:MAG: PAS domain-containing protein, partial [Verrucomicrobiota bacterium]